MRLFVAVVPPPSVLDVVERVRRPDRDGVRWTRRDQWHVTLRFLGAVPDEEVPAVARALDGAVVRPPAAATLGPAAEPVGRHVVALPVSGLDELAGAVVAATAAYGRPPERRPFHGHLTLARLRRGGAGSLASALAGERVEATFRPEAVLLVESRLHPGGARYAPVHERRLGRGSGA